MQDRPLQLVGRQAPAGRIVSGRSLEPVGDVVAVALAVLDREHRAQPIAGVVEQEASEQMPVPDVGAVPAVWGLALQRPYRAASRRASP